MKRLLLLLLFMVVLSAFGQTQQKPIPADQAFQFTATAKDYQTLVGMWEIKQGFYLYRDQIHFSPADPLKNRLGQPLMPITNITKDYPGTGKLPVYTGNLQIAVPVIKSSGKIIVVKVHYQGCSEEGYCYPPQTKIVSINLAGNYRVPIQPVKINLAPVQTITKTIKTPLSQQEKIVQFLEHHSLFTILVGFFVFGLLLSLTPCVLPMIPILSGIIISKSQKMSHGHAFVLSCAYVFGMAITYAIAGVIFSFIGYSVQTIFQQAWIIILFSLIFVAMALSLFGFYNIQLPQALQNKLTKMSNHQKHGSYIGASVMGCLSTLILSPCVTPPLVGALAYISQRGSVVLGGSALFVMGIGMGVPLLLIGAFSVKLLPKVGPWMNAIKYVLGVLMLAVAIWIVSRIISRPVTMILWASLAIGSAITMGALKTSKTAWQRIVKTLGILLFIYGIVLAIGAFLGNSNPFAPLNLAQLRGKQIQKSALKFISITTLTEAKKQLEIAKSQHQPVMMDFYANWCISCKEMDHYTFSNAQVQKQLHQFRLIRADVTKNNFQTRELEKHFNVVAPPTILFFSKNGKEIMNSRIIGEMSATKFLGHLQIIQKQL